MAVQKVFPPCGTNAAYRAHLKYKTPIDEVCREAAKLFGRQARELRKGVCADCKREIKIEARNRCAACYSRLNRAKRAKAKKK